MMQTTQGRVFLVGAGCGPADLITLRGMRILASADAVVYDALMDPDLLQMARPDAEKIPAGKRSGHHSMPQSEINELLINLAQQGKTVCRLKGGDPFVFGRGGEEAEALRAAGIACEEVPGVTSAVAVPAVAGIPVTHRGLSRSFHVITAHTAGTADGLPEHLEQLAGLEGTLVFLMGLKNLPRLAERLVKAGMPPRTPAAVCGTQTVRGTLADIAGRAASVTPPAVIVIGGSAGIDLWQGGGTLSGVTVGLTGTAEFRTRTRQAFASCGARVLDVQRSMIATCCTPEQLSGALASMPDWIAFTSPNGVETFFALLRQAKIDLRRLAGVRFAAVGPRTAQVLNDCGFAADLMPEHHHTAALGTLLAQSCRGADVLLASAEQCSPAPRLALEKAGIACRTLTLYRTETFPPEPMTADYLVFGSAGGVKAYFSAGGKAPAKAAVCIGPVTAAEASLHTRALTAEDTLASSLVQAVLKDLPQTV